MARMSIYVPDDLKARMDAVDSVNWSAVAQSQFERELRLHPKLTGDEMQATIERLKASKVAQTDDVIAAGIEAGKKWSMEKADYLVLSSLGDTMNGITRLNFKDNLIRIPDYLAEQIEGNPRQRGEYFEHGFCLGVMEVWKQIKDHLA